MGVDDQITVSPGFDSPSGNARLVPDLAASVPLANSAGWVWAPGDQHDEALRVLPTCQRSALKRLVKAAADAGISFRMAYEMEFTLFDEEGTPTHEGPSHGLRAFLSVEEFAADLFDALRIQGVGVEQIHPEHGRGQFEISVAAAAPLEAADQHVLVKLTIGRVARQHGLMVSFAPAVFAGAVGNGCHLHVSAWRDGRNLLSGGSGPEGITSEAAALLGGILEHLPGLLAVYAPSSVSYERLQPQRFAGVFTCWGLENREAALRLVRGTTDESANVELKVVDGASNPYLAAAAVIGAALDGLVNETELPPAVQIDPSDILEAGQQHPGLRRLPSDLGQSIDEFERSRVARATLGESLHQAFAAVRRLEWDTFRELDIDDTLERHRWRYG